MDVVAMELGRHDENTHIAHRAQVRELTDLVLNVTLVDKKQVQPLIILKKLNKIMGMYVNE